MTIFCGSRPFECAIWRRAKSTMGKGNTDFLRPPLGSTLAECPLSAARPSPDCQLRFLPHASHTWVTCLQFQVLSEFGKYAMDKALPTRTISAINRKGVDGIEK